MPVARRQIPSWSDACGGTPRKSNAACTWGASSAWRTGQGDGAPRRSPSISLLPNGTSWPPRRPRPRARPPAARGAPAGWPRRGRPRLPRRPGCRCSQPLERRQGSAASTVAKTARRRAFHSVPATAAGAGRSWTAPRHHIRYDVQARPSQMQSSRAGAGQRHDSEGARQAGTPALGDGPARIVAVAIDRFILQVSTIEPSLVDASAPCQRCTSPPTSGAACVQ